MTISTERLRLDGEETRFALSGAAQAFCNRGFTIACPWEGDLDDGERERFDALVAAIETYNSLASRSAGAEGGDVARRGIYIASKVAHAARWRKLRLIGYPIISSWIDEAGAGESKDLSDLWQRCIREASSAEVLVLNRDPNEILKGGWIELGAALATGVPVMAVGIEEFTVAHDKRIRHFPSITAVMEELKPMVNGVPFRSLKENSHGA